ncbi:MAG: esterase family protein, partial [Rhodococcus sp.]|nr:esterase family protein [Rhodococcus sp. (in: high G+C Gram-positive bacteria)]
MLGRWKSRSGDKRAGSWGRRAATSMLMAVVLPLGLAVAGGGATANAAFDGNAIDVWTDSSMGPIKSRVWRAADGNTNRVVYLLDGLRATTDISGWEHETDAGAVLASWNINVVEPVGGQSSFYSDWYAPS